MNSELFGRWLPWLEGLGLVVLAILVMGVILIVRLIRDDSFRRKTAYKVSRILHYLCRMLRSVRKEREALRQWEQGFSERQNAAAFLLREYHILIPVRLIQYRHGEELDCEHVRQLTNPLLVALATGVQWASAHQRDILERRKTGGAVSEVEVTKAERAFKDAQRRLYVLWNSLYICRLYHGMEPQPHHEAILNMARK